MLYLYLDESGDLGFDFFGKKPSKFFTIAVLAVRGVGNNRRIINAVKKTLKRKLKNEDAELKGTKTKIEVKNYFYRQAAAVSFQIYSLTLNKRRVYESLTQRKDRVYNYIAKNVLDAIPVEDASQRIQLIIDRSKSKREVKDFNQYIIRHLQGRLEPRVPLDIYHWTSHENLGLQAADLFSWGIFRKYEKKDASWFHVFESKVARDSVYLPEQ